MRVAVDENTLAQAAAAGDAQAFSCLAERVYDPVFAMAFRLIGSRADAEDLCHDVFLALPAKIASYRGTAAFRTWLYRVVVNAAHDLRRRQAAQGRARDGWGDWDAQRRADAKDEADRQDWLSRAMTALPPDLRDTAALVLDDLTHAETAEILGVSEGTVSWRMGEVRKRLRAFKEKELAE